MRIGAFDLIPVLLLAGVTLGALALVGTPSTWITLTVAGLAMGLLIFIMASGLTLVFGLMDVMNFAHGLFIAVGAYVAVSAMKWFGGTLAALVPAMLSAMLVAGLLGAIFERVIIKPVYGQHLKQILITTGGMIVAEQLIHVIWGPDLLPLARPEELRGALVFGDVALERFRLATVVVGLAIFAAMALTLNRTKLGLLIRAGVENREMVEALGYRIRRLFLGVFMTGSALAGLGGVMWALYREQVHASMSDDLTVLIFIVVIIGGLGSIGGCFIGAILVAMVANYGGFLVPKLALVSNILLMVAILMWRPRGLYAVTSR